MAALGQACEEECQSVLGHPGARVIPRTPFGVLPGVPRSGRIVASVWRPLDCRATREGSSVAARGPDEHGLRGTSSVTGNARNDGVGGSSPPVGSQESPMNRGIPADAVRTGIGARVDVASRLSLPVQRLDSGRHTISAGLGRSPRGQSSPRTWCKSLALTSSVKGWAAQAAMSSLTSSSCVLGGRVFSDRVS
jgi:hypothetical protein